MSRTYVTTPPPEWLQKLTDFAVAGGPVFLTAGLPGANGAGWVRWGDLASALRFIVVNAGAGDLTVTPEASYDGVHAEVGTLAPVAFTVVAGTSYGDPYGIDESRPYWRLSVSGASSGQWGVQGIKR
jgi:hypothetical protein